jgi:hypothetical protein
MSPRISRPAVLLPLLGALVLLLAATPVLDRWSVAVLRGVALLLALAAAACVDEPEARLLDASPTSFARRVMARGAVVCLLVLPVAVAAAVWTALAGGEVPGGYWQYLAVLVVAGLAVSAALRRWTALAEPAVVTGPLLVAGLLAAGFLGPLVPDVGLSESQWAAVVAVVAAGLLAVALRDPATAATRLGRR